MPWPWWTQPSVSCRFRFTPHSWPRLIGWDMDPTCMWKDLAVLNQLVCCPSENCRLKLMASSSWLCCWRWPSHAGNSSAMGRRWGPGKNSSRNPQFLPDGPPCSPAAAGCVTGKCEVPSGQALLVPPARLSGPSQRVRPRASAASSCETPRKLNEGMLPRSFRPVVCATGV